MAQPKKTKAAKPKAKKAKAAAAKTPAKSAAKKPQARKKPAPKSRNASSRRPAAIKSTTFNIAELIDHPLVADLLTVGAMAAVGAIADHNVKTRTGESETGSSRALKAAGKAAAAAVGKRLMTEVDAIKRASKPGRPKAPKRGST